MQMREAQGRELGPEQLAMAAAEPERDWYLELLIEAWNDLSTERPTGWQVGYIPWSLIKMWGEWNGLEHDETQLLIRIIRFVDAERVEIRAAKERQDKQR